MDPGLRLMERRPHHSKLSDFLSALYKEYELQYQLDDSIPINKISLDFVGY